MNDTIATWIMGMVLVVISVALLGGFVWGWKSFKVWSAGQDGKAELAQAQYNRQIAIEEAQANLEAEKLNALAEVERAKGASEAIEIEGGSLTERYIQYLWVRSNSFNQATTIYVPTETNLPILEATRLNP
jgi:cytoskeletal protein RodZ